MSRSLALLNTKSSKAKTVHVSTRDFPFIAWKKLAFPAERIPDCLQSTITHPCHNPFLKYPFNITLNFTFRFPSCISDQDLRWFAWNLQVPYFQLVKENRLTNIRNYLACWLTNRPSKPTTQSTACFARLVFLTVYVTTLLRRQNYTESKR